MATMEKKEVKIIIKKITGVLFCTLNFTKFTSRDEFVILKKFGEEKKTAKEWEKIIKKEKFGDKLIKNK